MFTAGFIVCIPEEATRSISELADKQNTPRIQDMFDDALGAMQRIDDTTTQNTDSELLWTYWTGIVSGSNWVYHTESVDPGHCRSRTIYHQVPLNIILPMMQTGTGWGLMLQNFVRAQSIRVVAIDPKQAGQYRVQDRRHTVAAGECEPVYANGTGIFRRNGRV